MQIILLEKVVNVGNLGEVVKVKDGYARNFLIPQRLARRATATAVAEFEVKRAELEKAAAAKLAASQAQGEKLSGLTVQVAQKAGVDGRLFGSVTNFDIAEALTKQGFAVEKAQIRMPTGPLKIVGEHNVSVALHTDVVVEVVIAVVTRRERVIVCGPGPQALPHDEKPGSPGFFVAFFSLNFSPLFLPPRRSGYNSRHERPL